MKTLVMLLLALLFSCQAQAALILSSYVKLGDSRFYTGATAAYLLRGDAAVAASVTAQIQAGTFNSHTPLSNILDLGGVLRGVRTLLISETTGLNLDLAALLTLTPTPFFMVVFSPDGTRFVVSEIKQVTLLTLTLDWQRTDFRLAASGPIDLDLWLSVGDTAATYAAWSGARFGTTGPNRGFDDDFDGNGVPNGVEYAFGSSTTRNDLIRMAADDAGAAVIDTPKPNSARGDLQISVVGRHNLVTGAWGDLAVRKASASPAGLARYEPDETPRPPKGFFKMRLSHI